MSLSNDNNVVEIALARETELRERNGKLLAANIKLKARAETAEARVAEIEAAARAAAAQHPASYGECPHDYDALRALGELVE